jgi:hypothetical protein
MTITRRHRTYQSLAIHNQRLYPSQRSWTLTERIKALKKKVTASQRLHIEMEAAEAFKGRHGKPPAKEQVKGKYSDIYPADDLDLLDEVIERVLKRY